MDIITVPSGPTLSRMSVSARRPWTVGSSASGASGSRFSLESDPTSR
ncbi:MAG: hypothetical protein R2716_10595 [Microthrixaceae bacterium]